MGFGMDDVENADVLEGMAVMVDWSWCIFSRVNGVG